MLSLAVLAVAGTNILFRTQILRRLVNEDPSSLAGEWSDPHAWIPGRIGLGSLTLRSRDHNIEWEARLENVEIEFSLIDLVQSALLMSRIAAFDPM